MGGLFVTGTDTNVGKTFVTCCLMETLKAHQTKTVYARKPIASGAIRFTAQKLISEDAMLLKKSSSNGDTLNDICPYLFEEAISPARAIKLNQQDISLTDLAKACQFPNDSIGIIEGAGGFYSPLTGTQLNSDLAIKLKWPVILVVSNQIGCLNQALLSISAIKYSQLELLAVILNDTTVNTDSDNYTDLCELVKEPCLHLPYQANKRPYAIDSLYHLLNL